MSNHNNLIKNLILFGKRHKKLRPFMILIISVVYFIINLWNMLFRGSMFFRIAKLTTVFVFIFIFSFGIRYGNTLTAGENDTSYYAINPTATPATSEVNDHKVPSSGTKLSSEQSTNNLPSMPENVIILESYSITADGTYLIHTAKGLFSFAVLVNSGQTDLNATLTADINLSEYKNWIPIADFASNPELKYSGIFNGDGFAVTGLSTTNGIQTHRALFGYIDGGTIKNLDIESGSLRGTEYLGGIAGINNGKIINCSSSIRILSSQDGIFIGGIAGINLGEISKCSSKAELDGGAYIGGITGGNSGKLIKCRTDGLISGEISIGGIAGINESGTILDSHTGKDAFISGETGIGGIAGINSFSSIIEQSSNSCSILGDWGVSGSVGINYGLLVGCWQYSNIGEIIYDITAIAGYNYGSIDTSNFTEGS